MPTTAKASARRKNPRPSLEVHTDAALIEPLKNPYPEVIAALGADVALHKISVTQVSSKYSNFSPLRDVTVGGLLFSELLARHEETPDKHGAGLIFADLQGRRKDVFAKSVCGLVRDIDGHLTFGQEVERRERVGTVGNTYTTHGNGGRREEFGCEPAYSWRGLPGTQPFTDEQAAAYLKYINKGYVTGVRVLHGGQPVHVEGKGHCFQVECDPITKLRSVEFYSESIMLDEVGQDGVRAIYAALSDSDYGEGMWDANCINPARIQYCPACPPGAPHALEIHAGKLRAWREDWERIQPAVLMKREKQKAVAAQRLQDAPADVGELAHYLGFISPSLGRKEWLSVICAINKETKASEQGRALVHSWSAGDAAKYNPDDLDGIWEWCDPDSEEGASMGTIVFLAKRADNFKKYRKGRASFNFGALAARYNKKSEAVS